MKIRQKRKMHKIAKKKKDFLFSFSTFVIIKMLNYLTNTHTQRSVSREMHTTYCLFHLNEKYFKIPSK